MYLLLTDTLIYPGLIHSLMSKIVLETKNLNCNVTNLHLGKDSGKTLIGARKGEELGLIFVFHCPSTKRSLCIVDSKMQCVFLLFLKLYVHMGVIQVDGW